MNQTIKEAAEAYAFVTDYKIINALDLHDAVNACRKDFIAGALSDAAKEYWLEQFKAAQKQVPTDEETAIMFLDSIREYERENGERICFDERSSKELFDEFKSALQLTNK